MLWEVVCVFGFFGLFVMIVWLLCVWICDYVVSCVIVYCGSLWIDLFNFGYNCIYVVLLSWGVF